MVQVCKRLPHSSLKGKVRVDVGDARKMFLMDGSVDAVITSPPYLNAIDYMRGHRLALVWFGFRLSELRAIRSNNIGAERAPEVASLEEQILHRALSDTTALAPRFRRMIERYAQDVLAMTMEVARVLKPNGAATFVVGNSCLTGVFIKNSEMVKFAARRAGLTLLQEVERDLPSQSRYLPTPVGGALGKRMRTETVLKFKAGRSRGSK